MPIVSSAKYQGHAQKDGRSFVREAHTDSAGRVHEFVYLADAGTDTDAVLAARALELNARLPLDEVRACIAAVLAGQNPYYFAWVEQSQAAGLRAVMQHFLGPGVADIAAVAPIISTFVVAEFAALVGVSPETAQAIVDWADQQLTTDQLRLVLAAQAAGEIGG